MLYVFLRFDGNTAVTIFTALFWIFTTCRIGTGTKVSEEPAALVYICPLNIHAANSLKRWPLSTLLYSIIFQETKIFSSFFFYQLPYSVIVRLKRDGTRAETRLRLSPKRTSPFKSAGASVQSTAGSRGVRISVNNAGYTAFWGSVRELATTPFASFPFTSPPVRHRVPSGFKRTLPVKCGTRSEAPPT